jgi:hypothetical protein
VRPESDGGLRYLEQKLGIFIQGPAQTRRNAALDILTGRAADERVLAPSASKSQPAHPAPVAPSPIPVAPTRIHPSFAYRAPRAAHLIGDALPAVDWTTRSAVSPWLAASDVQRPRLRIAPPTPPAPSRWPVVRSLLLAAATVSVFVAAGFGVRSFTERADGGRPSADLIAAAPEIVTPSMAVAAEVETPSTAVAAEVETPSAAAVPENVIANVATADTDTLIVAPSPPVPAPASVLRVLLDDHFTSNAAGWPNDPQGPGWMAGGTYRLAASQVSHFVAIGIPGTQALGDTVVSGWFRKIGGPAGGGYGLILRDQNPETRDGLNQLGRYYVFEVGDRGEVGVWLRDGNRWIDLLTWTLSDAVKSGLASNELTVTAAGDHMSFVVNGIPVASQTDSVLRTGGAGVFVGGDSNQVALDRIVVSSPT